MGHDLKKMNLIAQGIAGGNKIWVYDDTGGETIATYAGADFWKDAGVLGADSGDLLLIHDNAASATYKGVFTNVKDTGSGTVDLDTGSAAQV